MNQKLSSRVKASRVVKNFLTFINPAKKSMARDVGKTPLRTFYHIIMPFRHNIYFQVFIFLQISNLFVKFNCPCFFVVAFVCLLHELDALPELP